MSEEANPTSTTAPATITSISSSATPKCQGLDLAQHTFGPLLDPVKATAQQWQHYTVNRFKTIREVKPTRNIYPRFKGYESPDEDGEDYDFRDSDTDRLANNIRRSVRKIEEELGLVEKMLQKCVRILKCDAMLEEVDDPRTVDVIVRIWSPSTPTYIDVHLFYHCRMRLYECEWHYSVGYNIHRRVAPAPADPKAISEELNSGLETMHTRNGWRSISWGLYDQSNGNFGKNWRRIERGDVDLYEEGVLDIYETLFGKLPVLAADADESAKVERRRKLITAVRVLFASVGIDYEIGCEDAETDKNPGDDHVRSGPVKLRWQLEGLQDKWIARGVRKACGFQLVRDPEEAEKGKQERIEIANEPNHEYGSDDEDDIPGCPNQ